MTILFPMAVNKPGAPSVPPLDNSTPPDAVYCFLLAMKREPMMGNGGSAPPKVRTCHRSGSGGGEVPLLQNNYPVLHVVVHEVDLEVGECCPPPLQYPTGNPMDPSTIGKKTQYRLGSSVAGGVIP